MTRDEARAKVIQHWLRKADTALESAKAEFAAKRFDFAVNRSYYACFYAASAMLLSEDRKFVKHSGVRAAVHREFVKTGRLDAKWGKAYDRIFEARQAADYLELFEVDKVTAIEILQLAKDFVAEMRRLLALGEHH
jgi:uncharacterized protein (UPF0332 family)